jgi:3-methyladenine DNA glycosylase/8-oxoguanine DNA glycosylase
VALLALPQPYDFELSTGRFRAFGPDRANLWLDGALYRAVDGHEVRITGADGGVDVEPLDDATRPTVLTLLGSPFDLDAFRAFAAGEPILARIVDALPGLRPPLAPDPFESLVTSITAQQVSLHAAFAIRNRLILRFGRPVRRAHTFPSRESVAGATVEEIRAAGFSQRKAECLLALARSDLDLHALAALADDAVLVRLVALPGIGEWTADWFLARHLARPRAWPAGDLGLRKAVRRYYGDVEDVRAFGARFAPFENLSAHYLLAALLTGLTP